MLPSLYFPEINLGFFILQTWGVMASLGFLAALLISIREAKKIGIDSEVVWNIMILALLGMFLGGRIFYAISTSLSDGMEILGGYSGFSFIGGVILAAFLVFLYLRKIRQNIFIIADMLTIGFIASLIFVRTGCLLISDHIGKFTDLPIGMLYTDGTARHPIALYHIAFLLLIFYLVMRKKKEGAPRGSLFLRFSILASCLRFFVDFLRCDDLLVCDTRIGGLTLTQWVLIPIFVFSVVMLRRIKKIVL